MEFGIFSNGFRPHTTAQQTYEEDLYELVLADKLGFRDAYISEHHGEPLYIDRVDTLPVPELLMCKAAALTTRIRMGAAVKVLHLQHPLDIAIQAATTDHVVGNNRFIFGFGSGFSTPLFAHERGLSYEDRHARQAESLDFILKCWTEEKPFDWEGKYWNAKGVVATPRPLTKPHMPIATATETEASIHMAGARGYTLLTAHEPPHVLRRKIDIYLRGARAVGRNESRSKISNARLIYVADSFQQALEDLRPAVNFEADFQVRRGLFKMAQELFNWQFRDAKNIQLEDMVEVGLYVIGSPDQVAEKLKDMYVASGGFGTLLVVTGKNWADRQRRTRSLQRFMEAVAPQLRSLATAPEPDAAST